MSDRNSQLLRKAGFADLESALAAIDSMSDELRCLGNELEQLEHQYGFAMAERDEARRLYCEEWAFTIELERGEASDPRDLAAEKGWDCYDSRLPPNP